MFFSSKNKTPQYILVIFSDAGHQFALNKIEKTTTIFEIK